MTARERGERGETAALGYLVEKGYQPRERNWHSRYGEIDLIVEGQGCIVFVEVKLRASGSLVGGFEAVGSAKMKKLFKTACLWLEGHPCELQPRFDVVSVTPRGSFYSFEHIENAFGAEVCDEIF